MKQAIDNPDRSECMCIFAFSYFLFSYFLGDWDRAGSTQDCGWTDVLTQHMSLSFNPIFCPHQRFFELEHVIAQAIFFFHLHKTLS